MPHLPKSSRMHKLRGMDEEISHRILLLACFITIAFFVLFIRLVYIQVFSYNDYVAKKDDYTSIKQYVNAPRGQIFDCKGRVLAKTVVSHNIVYTSPKNMSKEDYKLYAQRLVKVFDVNEKDFTETDKKEAYITYKSFLSPTNKEYAANNLLTKSERNAYESGLWGSNAESKRHSILMKRIGQKQIKEMSTKQLKVAVVYQRMVENANTGQENVILEDVKDDDVAYLVEHKNDFPGFDVDFGGWKREYPYGETLSDVLGSVSTSTQGLPAENASYYLQRGFQYNATVGKSGLEYQYNDVLSGQAQVSKITYDSNGLAKRTIVQNAVKGDDVYLSIDIDLQQSLDDTVRTVLQANGGTTNRENFKTLFMTMMNPNDGSVLALSGYQKDLKTKKMTYFASGCYASLANPGSSVKGVTVYMGLSEGVIKPGEIIVDQPMNIGGQEFSSYENHGPVDDIQALGVSSNVYMFNIAIRLGKGVYQEGQSLHISDVSGTLDLMRSYYSKFGLGNKTGLDVPDEVSGYMGVGFEPGMLLNYSIGQMDMYTPIQLNEYVATVANNGNLYQPSLMKYIKVGDSDQVVQTGSGILKSRLPEQNAGYLNRVQQGFRQVVASGNASDSLQNMDIPVAGKTGTAEVNQWTTAVFIGYAPYGDPKVSFACVAPTSSVNSKTLSANVCANDVVPVMVQKYFDLYPQDNTTTESTDNAQ